MPTGDFVNGGADGLGLSIRGDRLFRCYFSPCYTQTATHGEPIRLRSKRGLCQDLTQLGDLKVRFLRWIPADEVAIFATEKLKITIPKQIHLAGGVTPGSEVTFSLECA